MEIEKCICPRCQMYLSEFQNIFVHRKPWLDGRTSAQAEQTPLIRTAASYIFNANRIEAFHGDSSRITLHTWTKKAILDLGPRYWSYSVLGCCCSGCCCLRWFGLCCCCLHCCCNVILVVVVFVVVVYHTVSSSELSPVRRKRVRVSKQSSPNELLVMTLIRIWQMS